MSGCVVSFCSGYPFVVFKRFVSSFLETHAEQHSIVLFSLKEQMDEMVLHALNAMGPRVKIHLVDVNEHGNVHCQNYRLKLTRDFIAAEADNFSFFFVSDARDVIFQDDVFAKLKIETLAARNKIHVFKEDKPIGKCQINIDWLKQLTTADTIERMKEQTVLCSGTIAGGAAPLCDLLDQMIHILKNGMNQMEILDQAALNCVIYNLRQTDTSDVVFHENDDGVVLTLAHRVLDADNAADNAADHVVRKNDGVFVTRRGERAACVHQFDRLWRSPHSACCLKWFSEQTLVPISDFEL